MPKINKSTGKKTVKNKAFPTSFVSFEKKVINSIGYFQFKAS